MLCLCSESCTCYKRNLSMITEYSKYSEYASSFMRGRYLFIIVICNDGKKKKETGREGRGGRRGLCNTITPLAVRL